MKKLQALKWDPFAVGHNNRLKINEIIDYCHQNIPLIQPLINGQLIYARFVRPENRQENDFYPVHHIEDKGEAYVCVIWCNRMTCVLPIEDLEFRAVESTTFNPFNENFESSK
jgi:hypothetical protein